MDTEIFFPETRDSELEKLAKKVCEECQVRRDCLEWALDTDEGFGILGGLTRRERRELVR